MLPLLTKQTTQSDFLIIYFVLSLSEDVMCEAEKKLVLKRKQRVITKVPGRKEAMK